MYRVWVLGGLHADQVYQTRAYKRALRVKRMAQRKGWQVVVRGPAPVVKAA